MLRLSCNSMKLNTFFILMLLLFVAQPISGQSFRAMYEGEEVNLYDGEVTRDLFILQISREGLSSFQSYFTLQRDSIRDACVQQGISTQETVARMRSIPPGSKCRLYYNPRENKYTEMDYGLYYFKATEIASKLDVVFEDSTKVVLGFHSEMAKAHYYGRDWVIFYTTEISLPYGPWKINGLPGVVTEAYSTDGAYRFQLKGFEVSEKDIDITIPTMMLNQPVIDVSGKELAWIRKQAACMDLRPIIKKYSKNFDMSGMYHDKIDQRYRELSKRYQYIEQ